METSNALQILINKGLQDSYTRSYGEVLRIGVWKTAEPLWKSSNKLILKHLRGLGSSLPTQSASRS